MPYVGPERSDCKEPGSPGSPAWAEPPPGKARSGAGLGLLPVDQQGLAALVDDVLVDHHLGHTIQVGRSNMVSISACSMIERRPRAPVLRFSALLAMARRAEGRISSSTPSIENSFWYCLTSAFLGSVRICTKALSSVSSPSVAMTGRRPTNSGIRPNLIRSSGSISRKTSVIALLGLAVHAGAKADADFSVRFCNDLLQAIERAAADEQDVGRVDLQEVLVRVLATALRRHAGHRAFDQLQQGLLHPFARDIAGDRWGCRPCAKSCRSRRCRRCRAAHARRRSCSSAAASG
jgi:hypothetical protein